MSVLPRPNAAPPGPTCRPPETPHLTCKWWRNFEGFPKKENANFVAVVSATAAELVHGPLA